MQKITYEDLTDGFPLLLDKVRSGRCCVKGCEEPTVIIRYDRSSKPIVCKGHYDNGELTHYGEWRDQWSCCNNSWKRTVCRMLVDKLGYCPDIPVSDEQLKEFDDEMERRRIVAEEQERWERILNAGREEAYDR
jgi:hypothetical protein